MIINEIFDKNINRNINGVVKADDSENVLNELEEYVLTNEIKSKLTDFFDAYNENKSNGVWISGFFGSGKSHLLKMLSLVLENKEIDGKRAETIFLEKCSDDAILCASIKKAVQVPSQSILFNIDQKSDTKNKNQDDAVLSVFMKVFNEICGYSPIHDFVADFERGLDKQNIYESFKKEFYKLTNKDWETTRKIYVFCKEPIAKAVALAKDGTDTTYKNYLGIIDECQKNNHLSVESFVEKVKDYIDFKEKTQKDFRLNFFVDEIGQYIADNPKLMLNLQTISESLFTICKGKAWIIVTSQNDMSDIIGDMKKSTSNDFSKIQARFPIKLTLSSKDINEVIEKRLLDKTDEGSKALSNIYSKQSQNLRTKFTFSQASKNFASSRVISEDKFINCYPFLPYQFSLFQEVITQLSIHDAFTGRHNSVGERSMLSVFQKVAIEIKDQDLNAIAPFDLMFNGLDYQSLKTLAVSQIIDAEKNLGDEFAVRVLKVLFMTKYVSGFSSTLDDITILMYTSVDENNEDLTKRVRAALELLERQTYIEKNGEKYSFLTNEEKDIENEIKSTECDVKDYIDVLDEIVYSEKLPSKIRTDNGRQYSYNKFIDDEQCGRNLNLELNIRVVSPFVENTKISEYKNNNTILANELLVVLPNDGIFGLELMKYCKTKKLLQIKTKELANNSAQAIISEKRRLNEERRKTLSRLASDLLSKAQLFEFGNKCIVNSTDSIKRITEGFTKLVADCYTNLPMIENEKQPYYSLVRNAYTLEPNMSESETEMFNFIKQTPTVVTLQKLVNHFTLKPYGWVTLEIVSVVSKLVNRNKVDVRENTLQVADLNKIEILFDSEKSWNTVSFKVTPDISLDKVKKLKTFACKYFDLFSLDGFTLSVFSSITNAKVLAEKTDSAFNELYKILQSHVQRNNFPFTNKLKDVTEKVKRCTFQPTDWYYEDFLKLTDNYLDDKDDYLLPMLSFINGQQGKVFEDVKQFISSNKANLDSSQLKEFDLYLGNENCYKGNLTANIKTFMDKVRNDISSKLKDAINKAVNEIVSSKMSIEAKAEFAKLKDQDKQEILREIDSYKSKIESNQIIDLTNTYLSDYCKNVYPSLLTKITQKLQSYQQDTSLADFIEETDKKVKDKTLTQKYINISVISSAVQFSKKEITSEQDAIDYVEAYKKALIDEIKKGTKVTLTL